MASIVFLQKELEDRLGAMVLAGYVKKHGHRAEIVVQPERHVARIQRAAPDFIGMTVLSPSLSWALKQAAFFKQLLPQTRIILGGPHATFIPEVVEQPCIDMICQGEGEKALLHLMDHYDGTLSSIEGTPNFWIKAEGRIVKNPRLPLLNVQELSDLPDADRSHYAHYPGLLKSPHRRSWTSRGCPYACSFCFNAVYNEMYRGGGAVVQQRSVASVIAELQRMKAAGARIIDMLDDQFLLAPKWTFEFCEQYRRHIGLPLIISSVVKFLDAERVRALKEAGCTAVNFGIESGVERIRFEVHNKPFSDEMIYRAAENLHRNGIAFQAYNIVGAPGETLEDMYASVRMNQEIHTTYPGCSVFQPYPGSPMAKTLGVSSGTPFPYSFFQQSILGTPERRLQVTNAQKIFAHAVHSRLSVDTFRRLVLQRGMLSKLYPPVFYWHYGNGVRRRFGHSWPSLAKYWFYANVSS